MTQPVDTPAAIALVMGLFALFAGVGQLRRPELWRKVLEEILASPALQVLTAMAEVAVGAAIYFVLPWDSGDWLATAMKVLGGVMMLEGLVIAAFCDLLAGFWLRRMIPLVRIWTWFALALGAALVAVAIPRF